MPSPAPNRPAADPLPIPGRWGDRFPSSAELSAHVANDLAPWAPGCDVDALALTRWDLETRLFKAVEARCLGAAIRRGFEDAETCLRFGQALLSRRMARSGRALANILADILRHEGVRFAAHAATERGRRPTFLFPSAEAYHAPGFPADRLCLLSAKVSCRERWRQLAHLARRIASPHLFTLDTALTESAFAEMSAARVRLVMPRALRGELGWDASGVATLREFIDWRLREQRGA